MMRKDHGKKRATEKKSASKKSSRAGRGYTTEGRPLDEHTMDEVEPRVERSIQNLDREPKEPADIDIEHEDKKMKTPIGELDHHRIEGERYVSEAFDTAFKSRQGVVDDVDDERLPDPGDKELDFKRTPRAESL